MPLYEYRCTACGHSFEKIQSFSAKPETECPKCEGELIRPVTAPALRFAGAGWYVNDYAGKGGAQKAESAGDASTASDSAKDTKTESKPGSASSEAKSAPATPAPAAAAPSTSSTPASDS